MKLCTPNLNNKIKTKQYESQSDFKLEIESIIKATVGYIEFNIVKIKNVIKMDDKNLILNELNDLLLILKTYCYLYHFDISAQLDKQLDTQLDNKLEIKVISEDINFSSEVEKNDLQEIIVESNNLSNSSLFINNNDLVEFWATFTSYWNLFVKYKLDGVYIFILTLRTFDKNELLITSSQALIIYNTLLQIYSFNKEYLYDLLLFFEYSVKSKLNIYSACQTEPTNLIN